jgi:hypothetical protein
MISWDVNEENQLQNNVLDATRLPRQNSPQIFENDREESNVKWNEMWFGEEMC